MSESLFKIYLIRYKTKMLSTITTGIYYITSTECLLCEQNLFKIVVHRTVIFHAVFIGCFGILGSIQATILKEHFDKRYSDDASMPPDFKFHFDKSIGNTQQG